MKSSLENDHDPSFDVLSLTRRFHSRACLDKNVDFSPGYLGVNRASIPKDLENAQVSMRICTQIDGVSSCTRV